MKTLAALALLLTIAACGGGVSAEQPMSAQQVAAKVGCQHWKPTSDELFIREGGSCDGVNGIDYVYSFSNDESQGHWLTFAREFGGAYIVGHGWVVTGHSMAALKAAQAKVGGEIQ